jgi:hypothetical protein
MVSFDANQIVDRLQRKVNLFRVANYGNTKIWFSDEIPAELPVGNKIENISTESVSLPYNNYRVLTNDLTGWVIFWKHLGPRCMAAGAFISISPLNSQKAVAKIELSENNFMESDDAHWMYGFESPDYIPYICKGLVNGLSMSCIDHPVADVKIRILNLLTHKVDTSPMAFEILGNYLMEAMVFEMYKRDWIESIKRP